MTKNFKGDTEYQLGFKVDQIFTKYNNGIETGKDSFFYNISKKVLIQNLSFAFQNKERSINEFEITNTDSFKFLDKFNSTEFNQNKITNTVIKIITILNKMINLSESVRVRESLVLEGSDILSRMPDWNQAFNMYNKIIKSLI